MFFFGVKKEPRSLDCPSSGSDAVRFTTWMSHFVLDGRMTCGEFGFSPHPLKPLWRSGARGQLGLRIKRGFVKFGTNPFSLYSCPRVISPSRPATPRPLWRNLVYLHKHKTNVKCEMNSSALHLNT